MSSQGDSQPSQDSTVTLMDEDRQEVIYFAYGSNLSTDQMLDRCPSSTPVGLGYLAGWRWIINERGYANIVRLDEEREDVQGGEEGTWEKKTGEGVYGLLYLLPPTDEAALDGYEGVAYNAYKKYTIDVVRIKDEQGKPLPAAQPPQKCTALVYVDDERVEGDVPRREYVVRMERGIREAVEDWGMSGEYAEELRGWLRGETQG